MAGEFEFYAIIAKADDGDNPGTMRFTGVASSTGVDKQQENVTEKALDSMAQQLPMVLACAGSHNEAMVDPRSEIGMIDNFTIDDGKLLLAGCLDEDHPWASWLYKGMAASRWKLSIGGRIPEGARRTVHNAKSGMFERRIDEVQLDHVLLCRPESAINQECEIKAACGWAEAIAKAGEAQGDTPEAFGDLTPEQVRDLIWECLDKTESVEVETEDRWLEGIYEDFAVIHAADGNIYQVPFSIEDGELGLGQWVEVSEELIEASGEPLDIGKAVWSTAYVNNLPDSAFLYIESGGSKDSEGKTTPRGLRHLPYKDTAGKVDAAHLRNAIARASQIKLKSGSSISAAQAEQLQSRAQAMLERANKAEQAPAETTSPEGDTIMGDPTEVDRLAGLMETLIARLEPVDKAGADPAGEDPVAQETSEPEDQGSLEKAVTEALAGISAQLVELADRMTAMEKAEEEAPSGAEVEKTEEDVAEVVAEPVEDPAEEPAAEPAAEVEAETTDPVATDSQGIDKVDDASIERAINILTGVNAKLVDDLQAVAAKVTELVTQSNANEAAISTLQKASPQSLQVPTASDSTTQHPQESVAGDSPIQALYNSASGAPGLVA